MSVQQQDAAPQLEHPVPASIPRAPSARPGVGVHFLRYSIGSVLVMLAGFVSFPILTRLLDNTQYGIMGYFNTWVLIAIALAKLGGQHAVIRFYPHDGDRATFEHFSTNLVVLPMTLSFVLWATVALGLLAWQWSGQGTFSSVFWCVVLLVPVLVMGSFVQMVVRAAERSGLVMATRVLGRYLELALVVGFVVWIERSALSAFTGRLVAGAVLLAYFVYWSVRNLTFSRRQVDFAAMGAALMYGLPLMVNEFAGMVLSAFDRVLLKEITGDYAQVGIYTIGYALAMHINLLMNSALWEAFVPVANRVYGTEGEAAVRELKGRMLVPIVYASVGVATMVFAIGQDAIVALAGQGKAQSGAVFVVVGTMMALYPMFDISAYGLLLKKRSGTVLLITAVVTALNIGANFLLIPKFGFMGAAYAMVISHVVLWGAYFALCPRGLLRLPDLRTVATAVGAAAVLLGVIEGTDLFGIERAWPRVIVGGVLFLGLYVLPVWLLDARLRVVLPKLRQGGA